MARGSISLVSRFKHNFQPGKHDPLRCALKIPVTNPDGEDEYISCGEHRDSYIHMNVSEPVVYTKSNPSASWNNPK